MNKTNNNSEEEKPSQETKQRIYKATEQDWEDFFAVQENLDTLFDR